MDRQNCATRRAPLYSRATGAVGEPSGAGFVHEGVALRWTLVLLLCVSTARGGLNYLARNQDPGGSWSVDGKPHVGLTSVSVLAFLGAGYTTRSTRKMAAHYALSQHALATLTLCETYWMTRDPRFKAPAERALRHLGGLRPTTAREWLFKALARKAAIFAKLHAFLMTVETPPPGRDRLEARVLGAVLGATPARQREAFQRDHKRPWDPRDAAELLKRLDRDRPPVAGPNQLGDDFVSIWLTTLAMFQVGREQWKTWNKAMVPFLVKTQHRPGNGAKRGSWDPVGDCWGRIGATAFGEMCLETYYRYDRVFGLKGRPDQRTRIRGQQGWWRSTLPPHVARVALGNGHALPMKRRSARVRIDGFRARILMAFDFVNDTTEIQEGLFELRLPDGAAPWFLAFGETTLEAPLPALPHEPSALEATLARLPKPPKVATMAPRNRARRAYTTIVSGRRDPALLEWAGQGIFHARVFPLAPRGVHRVLVGWDVNLEESGELMRFVLQFPDGPQPDVKIDTGEAQAQIIRGENGRRYEVKLPLHDVALVGRHKQSGDYTAVRIRMPDIAVAAEPPKHAIFLLDLSESMTPELRRIHLRILRAVLERNRPGYESFEVCTFGIDRFAYGRRPNAAREVELACAWARTRAAAGGTDFGAALRGLPAGDVFLLSDGVATWGDMDDSVTPRRQREARLGRNRIFAFRTGFERDAESLEILCRDSSGAFLDAPGEAELARAVGLVRMQSWRVRSVAIDGCTKAQALATRSVLGVGRRLTIAAAGRPAASKDAKVRIVLEDARGEVRQVEVPLPPVVDSALAARVYGALAVRRLERDELALGENYARHFRVVGRSCSLVMLESEADYLRFGIDTRTPDLKGPLPPRPAKETLRARWERLVDSVHEEEGASMRAPPLKKLLRLMPDAELRFRPGPLDGLERTAGSVEQLPQDLSELIRAAEGRKSAAEALRIISTHVEREKGDAGALELAGRLALSWGLPGHACRLLDRALQTAPSNPARWFHLGRAAEAHGRIGLALLCYRAAAYSGIVDPDLEPVKAAADMHLEAIARRYVRTAPTEALRAWAKGCIPKGPKPTQDLFVYMVWDESCDLDLSVQEPSGEVCSYRRLATSSDAELARDVTRGYGPESYRAPRAKAGAWIIRIDFLDPGKSHARSATAQRYIHGPFGVRNETVVVRPGKPAILRVEIAAR